MTAQPAQTAPYVFLSYASVERVAALTVADALEAAGIPVWIDRTAIAGGSSWSAEIVRGIRGCAALAVLCSPAAVSSPNVQQELNLALEQQRSLLPLLLEPTEFPDEVQYALAGRQRIELLHRPAATWLPEVLRALARFGIAPAPPAATFATSAALAGNLPVPLSSFVGRAQEVDQVVALLDRARLVTLTGPGGTGKTRLALAAAERVAGGYPDSVWFVDLSGVADPALVVPAIAQVLGVGESEGRSLAVSLAGYLRRRHLLLVLDNFEQVVLAGVHVYDLLSESRELRVLVTSRILLRVDGEHTFGVPPLPLPAPQQGEALSALATNPAVQLFMARAQALRPEFTLDSTTAPAIAAICTRLDGLPLAIELAAARLRLLPPLVLLERLDRRLQVLIGGERNRPARQQTLRGALQWSWELLEEPEQALFRRLGVFAGGWTLAAALAVCDPDGELDVLEALASLADKSLIREDHGADEARFVMLATLREFALEQLALSGEAEATFKRFDVHFCGLAQDAVAAYWESGRIRVDLLQRLDRERDNLMAVLQRALEQHNVEASMLLAEPLGWWWYHRAPSEGQRWLRQLLALPEATDWPREQGRTAIALASCSLGQGTMAEVVVLAEQAVSLLRAAEDLNGLSRALAYLACWLPPEEAARAAKLAEEALSLARHTGSEYTLAYVEGAAGGALLFHGGDLQAARALLEQSLQRCRGLDADAMTGFTLWLLATLAQAQGGQAEALDLLRGALPIVEAVEENGLLLAVSLDLAMLASWAGDQQQAAAGWRHALSLARDLGSSGCLLVCLMGSALVLVAPGQEEEAARLLGAASGRWVDEEQQAAVRQWQSRVYGPARAATQAAMSAEAFAAAWAAGATLSLDQATALALDVLSR